MMKKFAPLFIILSALSLAALISLSIGSSTSAYSIMEGVNAARGSNVPATLFGGTGIITIIINTMLFIAGALSVIMIIIGGLRYAISAGNSSNVTAAKNTVIYAIIGLIVAFLAYAAVNFVLGAVESGGQLAPSNR